MRTLRFLSVLLGLIAVSIQLTSAQVTTGVQPLGSYGGGPEAVNLANLNIHWDFPIRSKAGRGLNFVFALGYDGAIWTPDTQVNAWAPLSNWGWTTETQTQTGYVTATTNLWKCFQGTTWSWATTYAKWVYVDRRGTPHPFSLPTISTCHTFPGSASGTAADGSGYQIAAYPGSAVVNDVAGHALYPPFNTGSGSGTAKDDNGNEITYNGTTFTDTLGTTALTKSGTNPVTYAYTGPSGTVQYTVSYVSRTVKTNFGCGGRAEYGPTSVSLVDKITLPDTSYYQFTYEATPGFPGDFTGRIASVRLPTGGTITYSYTGGNNGITCSDGSTATLTRVTPDGRWVYAHTESGTAWTTTVTDQAGDLTTFNFQDVFINTQTYIARSEYETERQVTDVSRGLLQTTVTCYNGHISANCNSTSVNTPIQRKTVFPQLPGPQNLESETDTTYNSYGLPTEIDEYDYGTSGTPGAIQRTTLISYASLGNDIQDHPSQITVQDGSGQVKSQSTYCYDEASPGGATCGAVGSPTPTTGTPQHVAVTGSRGNPTTLKSLTQGSNMLTKTFTYYDTGNVNQSTDTNGSITTYTYGGCSNSFPTQIALPLGLSTTLVWDCNGGVVTSSTDANNQITRTSYVNDPFWRPVTITDPLNNVTTNTYTPTTIESAMNFGSSTIDVLATVDVLGRKKLSQRRQGQAPGTTTFDTVQYSYDSNGRVSSVTHPCVATAGAGCTGAATTTTYDALNRPATVQDGGGTKISTTSYTYSNNDVLQDFGPAPAGENDKRKQLQYDGLGRLASVCEITSMSGSGACSQSTPATGFYTTYAYDVLGNITSVAQGTSQNRTFVFDDLGRMTSEQNPETLLVAKTYIYDVADSSCGSYSSPGDLVEKKDAIGNVTCITYDALHRATQKSYPAGSYGPATPRKCFTFDSAMVNGNNMSFAKTRLAEAYTTSSATCDGSSKIVDEGFGYSARGELTDVYESTPHSGGYYHASATYMANGALNSLSGIGQQAYTYGVDGEGRPYSAAQGSTTFVASTTYNAASQPLVVSLYNNNGDNDSYQYDPNTGQMTSYAYTVGSPAKTMSGSLTWNANRTLSVLAITDGFNSAGSQTCLYGDPTHSIPGYDDLGRLVNVSCNSTPVWSQAFTFDPFGNITKSGTSSWMPGYDPTTNRYTLNGTSYDGNGNLMNDTSHSYTWDSDANPVTIDSSSCGNNGTCLTYDALDRAVEKNVAGTYSEIQYGPTGKIAIMSGATQIQAYVPLPGGEALSPSPDTYWHGDWLGSVRLVTNASQRTVTYDRAFAPFGELYNTVTGGSANPSFTGLTQDTISGEYDSLTRRLHPGQGRWISPDMAGMTAVNPGDPQTWNRYVYARNTPLMGIDPSGMRMNECPRICPDIGQGGGGGDGLDFPLNCDSCDLSAICPPDASCGSLIQDALSGLWSGVLGLPTVGCGGTIYSGPWCNSDPMVNPIMDGIGLGLPPMMDPAAALDPTGWLTNATCQDKNPFPGYTTPTLTATWTPKNGTDYMHSVSDILAQPSGGHCVPWDFYWGQGSCYLWKDSQNCSITICPGMTRGINPAYTGFTEPFPMKTVSQSCAKIQQ